MASKRLRIPNEDVWATPEELAVTQTRTFQRLFDLKQLGLAYLVYPNASHTRGAHSIRCLGEAKKILVALKREEDEHAPAVRMAALLHDIGHVAFSHTLEDENVILAKHDRPARLDQSLAQLKSELLPGSTAVKIVDAAAPILHAISNAKDSEADWRSDLVGNTVCADLLAYIITDAEWTGIEKRPGHYRIYEYFIVHNKRLCIKLTKGGLRTDIISAIMDLLDMRYALTERVIVHHAKCVASAMLARAARLCDLRDVDQPELMKMGDEGFLSYLEKKASGLVQQEEPARGRGQGALKVLDSLRSRRLYQRLFKVSRLKREEWDSNRSSGDFCNKWRNRNEVERLLEGVERSMRLPQGTLAMWCPEQKSGMKLVEAHVIWETATETQGPRPLRELSTAGTQFAGVAQRIETIEKQYLDLWTLWIAIDRQQIARAPEVVQELERGLGVECDLVFRETYLNHLPGFKERTDNLTAVTAALHQLEAPIIQTMNNQAALTGEPTFDQEAIYAAAREAIGQRIETQAPRRKKKPPAKDGGGESLPSLDQE
jgi:HD superfamily phosphohydrolase